MNNLSSLYQTYCRPKIGRILNALGLDIVYHRALQNHMYYFDEAENEHQVVDFLGGYGSALLGHNHPELIRVAKQQLDQAVPFHAQASCRAYAARLSEKLHNIAYQATGKKYLIHFANSGTEAVEAAIKHAELSHYEQIKHYQHDLLKQFNVMSDLRHRDLLDISDDFYHMLNKCCQIMPLLIVNPCIQQ